MNSLPDAQRIATRSEAKLERTLRIHGSRMLEADKVAIEVELAERRQRRDRRESTEDRVSA